MACGGFPLCCFDDGPHPDDPYGGRANRFAVNLGDACTTEPACCCLGFWCPYPTIYKLRSDYLRGDMSRYTCCQSQFHFCSCFKPGHMGERDCPEACLCLEVCFCPGLSISATRISLMNDYQLGSDPFDRRLIRFSNCLQCMSCICSCAAIFVPECRDAARMVRRIADCVFWSVLGCMSAQVHHEMKIRNHATSGAAPKQGQYGGPPPAHNMNRNTQPVTGVYNNAQPQQQMMQVTCPNGAGPGMMIQVADPYGRMMQVQVPMGIGPGNVFMVAVPNQAPVATATVVQGY